MFHTNYLGGFLVAGFGVSYLMTVIVKGHLPSRIGVLIKNIVAISIGFAVAFGLVLGPIMIWGDVGNYFGKQFAFLSVYRSTNVTNFGRLANHFTSYLPLMALYIGMIGFEIKNFRRGSNGITSEGIFVAQISIVLIFSLLAALASGNYYPHYFILLLPGLVLTAGIFLSRVPRGGFLRAQCVVWLLLLSLSLSIVQNHKQLWKGISAYDAWIAGAPTDVNSAIVANIMRISKLNDISESSLLLYVHKSNSVLYYLTGTKPLTKYPFYVLYLHDLYAKALGVVPKQEINRILAANPQFIVVRNLGDVWNKVVNKILRHKLKAEYIIAKKYKRGWQEDRLYVHKDLKLTN